MEATVQTDKRSQDKERFLKEVKAALDQIDSPNFVICIDRFEITEQNWTPSTSKLIRDVKKRLSEISTNTCTRQLPSWTFPGKGWTVSVYFEQRCGQEGCVSRSHSFKETPYTQVVLSTENIRKAIADKVHFGNLDHPYIIAINVMEIAVDHADVFEALYGSFVQVYNLVNDGTSAIGNLEFSKQDRKPNGSFLAGSPQYTKVSAVWVAKGLLGPYNIGSAQMYPFEIYFAAKKFIPDFPCLRTYYINDKGELEVRNGLTPQQILGIESHWPEDNPPPRIDSSIWL